jgi:hypothetical protein
LEWQLIFRGQRLLKGLLFAILGAITGWFLWGLFTKEYDSDSLTMLIIGIVIGNSINKKEREVSELILL